jgi:hypothetical protein
MNFSGNGMEAFQYTALPARVVFGFSTIAKVADELVSLDCKMPFVLSDPHPSCYGCRGASYARPR